MSMIIFYVVLAAESECDIIFSPSLLIFAVQEVEIFAFFRKLKKKIFEQKWTITMFDMFFNVFLDKESKKKNIRINLSSLFLICWRF